MAHEKALKEARKALDLGYSEKEAEKLLKARGMDKDEIKKDFTSVKAQKIMEDAKKAEKAASEKKPAKEEAQKEQTKAANNPKSRAWFYILILLVIAAIVYLFYSGKISTDILNIKNFKLFS